MLTHALSINESWVGFYVQPKEHRAKVWVSKDQKAPTAMKED